MGDHILTINAGSSSVKFALFSVEEGAERLVASGQADGLGAAPRFRTRIAGGEDSEDALNASNHDEAFRVIMNWIVTTFADAIVVAVGHRVVHGGLNFAAPAIIEEETVSQLRSLVPLAPLHQPHNLAGIEAALLAFPGVPQIACFDTAFHRGHAFVDDAYALPRDYFDRGLRRFGFHGLSYESIACQMSSIDQSRAKGRVIVAHLGNGASACAMKYGRSVASTMGFSALEGLPMGTRCGQIDPGLVLYLIEHEGMSVAELTRLLYEQSGLKGLSGVSSDMRALEASRAPQAQNAIDYFVHRLRMEIGALAATLSGIDALVFTGGIGENSVRVRAAALAGMDWLGLTLNHAANIRGEMMISDAKSAAAVYVLRTDEEAVIARQVIETAGIRQGSRNPPFDGEDLTRAAR